MSDIRARAKQAAEKQRQEQARQSQQLKKTTPVRVTAPPLVAEVHPELTSEPVQKLHKLPVRRAASPGSTRNLTRITLAVVGILTVAFIVFFIQTQRRGGIMAKMYTTCHDVFQEDYYAGYYTAHQMVEGCLIVAQETIDRYGQEVNYCFDNENQTDARFMACLVDNEVRMYATALLTAPEE